MVFYTNQAGCDSLLIVDVSIFETTIQLYEVTSCDSFIFNNSTYTQSGIYDHVLINTVGCDSTEQLTLTILNNSESELNIEGLDSISVNGTMYYTEGQYVQYLQNSNGCDSTITINLTMEYSGLNYLQTNDLLVFPNPTHSQIHIQFPNLINEKITVTDAFGRIQKVRTSYMIDEILLDLYELANGIYYIHFDSKELPVIQVIKN